jgi:DNA primase
MRDPLEEIRARIDLVELVSEYVRLERAGKNFRGLCPFHPEKTPSFNVSPALARFHCFGCGASGDLFGFLMRIEGVSFREALEKLAQRAGIVLTPREKRPEVSELRDRLKRAMVAAQFFFRHCLQKSKMAQAYIQTRGIEPAVADKFGLGYAPDKWDSLTLFLQKHKVEMQDAQQAGLIEDNKQGHYDRFRGRLMFPIHDLSGKVVAFGGRIMGQGEPKYLNSPETPLFEKRKTFYGWHLARGAILRERSVLIVEGYLDLIMLHQYGFEHSLATLGTAFTEEHALRLKRLVDQVYLLYDSDEAGAKASIRAAEILQNQEIPVFVVSLPTGEDPDSLLRSKGASALKQQLKQATRAPMFALHRLVAQHQPPESAEWDDSAKIVFLQAALPIVAGVPTAVERETYIEWLAPYSPNYKVNPQMAAEALRQDIRKLERRTSKKKRKSDLPETPAPAQPEVKPSMVTVAPAVRKAEQTLLRAACSEDYQQLVQEVLNEIPWQIPEHRAIVEHWLQNGQLPQTHAPDKIIAQLPDEAMQTALTAAFMQANVPIDEQGIRGCVAYIKERCRKSRLTELRATLETLSPDDPKLQEYYSLLYRPD